VAQLAEATDLRSVQWEFESLHAHHDSGFGLGPLLFGFERIAKTKGPRPKTKDLVGDECEMESRLTFNQLICEFESRHPRQKARRQEQ
jgi:hypothetical protein